MSAVLKCFITKLIRLHRKRTTTIVKTHATLVLLIALVILCFTLGFTLENEAYNEKLLSLNNELTALTSDLSAKEKLGQRLR